MPLTIADLEDVQMMARETWMQFISEQDAQFLAPMRNALIGAMWNGIDDMTHANLEAISPEASQAMDERYGGMNASTSTIPALSADEAASELPMAAAGSIRAASQP